MKSTSDPDERIATGEMRDITESITCQKKRGGKTQQNGFVCIKKKS